ncbi:MAG: Fic family protein [Blastocatellia bacterium]
MPALPIYQDSYRPSSNWVKTVAEKQAVLARLQPLSNKIQTHLLINQVTQNLQLEDIEISFQEVENLIKNPDLEASTKVQNLVNAINCIDSLLNSSEDKTKVNLTSELVRQIHALSMFEIDLQAGFYRQTAAKIIAPGHDPCDAIAVSMLVDNALDWFSTDSFRELHPLEQAWLVHLRIMDLQPFEQGNSIIARLMASFYAQKAGLCPVIVSYEEKEFYTYALNNALMMITQPGVELLARSVIRTYDQIISLIENS